MVVIFKRQRSIGLDALREVWIAAGHQNKIAFERAAGINRSGAVNARVKSVIRPEQLKRRALGKQFGSGGGREKLLRVELIDGLVCVERIDLNAESRVAEYRLARDLPDRFRQRLARLRLLGMENRRRNTRQQRRQRNKRHFAFETVDHQEWCSITGDFRGAPAFL